MSSILYILSLITKQVPEHIINKALDDRWHVRDPIQHYTILIVTRGGAKGCIPFNICFDMDEIDGIVQVQFIGVVSLQWGLETEDNSTL